MSLAVPCAGAPLAFGVDPTRRERFSLRQARYDALRTEIGRLLAARPASAGPLKILDVGVGNGVSMRYIETVRGANRVEYHGVDIQLQPAIYNASKWASLQPADLLDGLSGIASNQFDVVLCEQVLEHLPDVAVPMAALNRVLKPGGTLIVGVPIFPPGVNRVRDAVVPLLDRVFPRQKARGHLQSFSQSSFVGELRRHCDVAVQAVRGFRILSGGALRPLENFRWWWQFGRFTGRLLPAFCTEIQVVAVKRG